MRISLHGLRVIPTSLTLRASFRTRYHGRIQHAALVVSRTYSTAPSSSNLVVSGKLSKFPLGISNFRDIRKFPGLAYFDKTNYISAIAEGPDVQLVCRPRRFGKSLTVSMLRSFHGVEYRDVYDQLFKGLNVDKAVNDGKVLPGQYLVLEFDFSRVTRSPKLDEAAQFLADEINVSLLKFTSKYTEYLGESFASQVSHFTNRNSTANLHTLVEAVDDALRGIRKKGDKSHPLFGTQGIYLLADEYDAFANEYMDPYNPRSWSSTEPAALLKGFWSTVKGSKAEDYGIKKVYVTGVTPLLLSDLTSGANEQQNRSFHPQLSTMCGLTRSDVLEALKAICDNEEEVQTHLKKLEFYTNGYHFCKGRRVELVFNTQTALSYLQAVKEQIDPEAENPENSEVSEPFLQICAGIPAAVQDIQHALQRDEHGNYKKIPYSAILSGFKLSELGIQAGGEGDISAWRSLMVYMGGLTFDPEDPSKFLKIPNLVAAKRFGHALLSRINLYQSMTNALRFLSESGNIKDVLTGYRRLIQQRDVGNFAFRKTEENHRDSIRYTILENPALTPKLNIESERKGYVDLLIENKKNLYTVLEFKNIQINYLGLTCKSINDKAKQLEDMTLTEILELKFKGDKFRSGTIQNWFDGITGKSEDSGSVREQLQSYIMGRTVQEEIADKNFRAFAVVIVGSRQILMREMGRDGEWAGEFQLA